MSEFPAEQQPRKKKVIVLGGGAGGMSAAFLLSSTPELRARLDVTVYQLGWRLGGKGGSGRNPDRGDGIEEHGLHIWFGFYEHAFRLMHECYGGLRTHPEAARLPHWERVFSPCDRVVLLERLGQDTVWHELAFWHPPERDPEHMERSYPGRPDQLPLTLDATLEVGAERLAEASDETSGNLLHLSRNAYGDEVFELAYVAQGFRRAGEALRDLVRTLAARARRWQVNRSLADVADALAPARDWPAFLAKYRRLDNIVDGIELIIDRARLLAGALELVGAIARGISAHGLRFGGWPELDEYDLREWLIEHGASEATVRKSPILRAFYDMAFAYRDGDKDHPNMAAGRALMAMLRMGAAYEGAFMWKMNGAMGDVIFAPLYLLLRSRGVHFKFFHRVTELGLSPDGQSVASVNVTRQVELPAEYEPLERVICPDFPDGLLCWPNRPVAAQFSGLAATKLRDFNFEGPDDPKGASKVTLRGAGEDFDSVVLAIPVSAQHRMCAALAKQSPRFGEMLTNSHSVATQALQVWLTDTSERLGQPPHDASQVGPHNSDAVNFDTYCDMSHLLSLENHTDVKSIGYFCSVLADDPASAATPLARARDNADALLQGTVPGGAPEIWPAGVDSSGALRTGLLAYDPPYVRANVEPSDRYITTPAGSVRFRLDPEESGFRNLVLAGDWTHNGIDGGSVEAAVVSGLRAGWALITGHRSARAVRRAMPRFDPVVSPIEPERSAYVRYGALSVVPGPLRCRHVRLYCFLIDVGPEGGKHLRTLCEDVFSGPSGGAVEYQPVSNYVMVTWGTIGSIASLSMPFSGMAETEENEVGVWVPTIGQSRRDGDRRFAAFVPYMWVDNALALTSGREVYGFAKEFGYSTRLPSAGGSGWQFDLHVYGVRKYGSGARLEKHRLLRVERSGGASQTAIRTAGRLRDLANRSPASIPGVHTVSDLVRQGVDSVRRATRFGRPPSSTPDPKDLQDLVRQVVQSASGLYPIQSGMSDFLAGRVRHVFLKQIRAADDGHVFDLQQVIETTSTIRPGSFEARLLTDTYELEVKRLDSHPLEDQLGLRTGQPVVAAFTVQMDFELDLGTVIWDAARGLM